MPVFSGIPTFFDANGLEICFPKFLKQFLIEGMDIVNKIAETDTDYSDRPLDEQKMKKVTVDTMGTEYPEPEKA